MRNYKTHAVLILVKFECVVVDGGDRRLKHGARPHRVAGNLRQTAADPLVLAPHCSGQR